MIKRIISGVVIGVTLIAGSLFANDYYSHSGWPATGAAGTSASARAEMQLIQSAFDLLPTLTGAGDEVVKINAGGTAMESVAQLGVAQGGTGAATLTDGGVLLGSGTGAVTPMAVLADGEIIVGDGATDPVALAAFTSSTGTLTHEAGGLEFNASAVADGDFIVGTGTGTMGLESGATARTSLGLVAGGAGDIWVEKAGDTMTGNLTISNINPQFILVDTDASADNGKWYFTTNTEQLRLAALNDALSVATNWLTVDRTGTTIDSIDLDATTLNTAATTLSFDTAATIDTSGNNDLTLDPGTANVIIGSVASTGVIFEIARNATAQAAANIPTVRLTNTDTAAVADDITGSFEFYSEDASDPNLISGFVRNVAEDAGTIYSLTFGSKSAGVDADEGMRLTGAGNLLIGTTTAATGNPTLDVIGTITGSDSVTDSTNKNAFFSGRHRTNAEENLLGLQLFGGTTNVLSIGGGNAAYNTAQQIKIFTAGDNTTVTGTERIRFSNSANNLTLDTKIGGAVGDTPSARLHVADSATTLSYFESTDAGAGAGPFVTLYRNSASPADNDLIGALNFAGEDDAGNETSYARLQAQILDAGDGAGASEDGRIAMQTIVAGSFASRVFVGQGLFTANATGGDQGADSINASQVYEDGVSPPTDYVLDQFVDGGIDYDFYANTPFPDKAKDWNPADLDIDDYERRWRKRRALPPFMTKDEITAKNRMSVGEMAQALLETAEVHAVHIAYLNHQIKLLWAAIIILALFNVATFFRRK